MIKNNEGFYCLKQTSSSLQILECNEFNISHFWQSTFKKEFIVNLEWKIISKLGG